MNLYLNTVEFAPGQRVALRVVDGYYLVEVQEHKSVVPCPWPWEFDADGWRSCTTTGTRDFARAVALFNETFEAMREYELTRAGT